MYICILDWIFIVQALAYICYIYIHIKLVIIGNFLSKEILISLQRKLIFKIDIYIALYQIQ